MSPNKMKENKSGDKITRHYINFIQNCNLSTYSVCLITNPAEAVVALLIGRRVCNSTPIADPPPTAPPLCFERFWFISLFHDQFLCWKHVEQVSLQTNWRKNCHLKLFRNLVTFHIAVCPQKNRGFGSFVPTEEFIQTQCLEERCSKTTHSVYWSFATSSFGENRQSIDFGVDSSKDFRSLSQNSASRA